MAATYKDNYDMHLDQDMSLIILNEMWYLIKYLYMSVCL